MTGMAARKVILSRIQSWKTGKISTTGVVEGKDIWRRTTYSGTG
jgi:hypothetical protein